MHPARQKEHTMTLGRAVFLHGEIIGKLFPCCPF